MCDGGPKTAPSSWVFLKFAFNTAWNAISFHFHSITAAAAVLFSSEESEAQSRGKHEFWDG